MGSLSKEARICSKAKDHSTSCRWEFGSGTLGGLGVSEEPSGEVEASPLGGVVSVGVDSSSGSPWNKLYRVLENWMN
uniref:Uncharacterized protein n=1 Tax=Scleropages formosus TaxID=113540 RepID=A0A8C9T6N9_SCLFO